MRVILLKDVPSLGRSGSLVEVKEGYARNFLLPRGLAREATEGAVRAGQQQTRAEQERRAREEREIGLLVHGLEGLAVEVQARAGADGRLFGAVTPQDVAEAVSARGFAVTKKQIEIGHPIKLIGPHSVGIRLPGGRMVHVEVRVVPTAAHGAGR